MASRTNTFSGQYQYSIDNKGRINVPAKFRQSLSPDSNDTFVITRGLDPCLWIYPMEEWERIEDNLRNLSFLRPKERQFIRQIVRWATPAKYDKQGRITIPSTLLEIADLQDEAIIIGYLNKIEVWNPDDLESEAAEVDFSDDEYESLANQNQIRL